MAFGITTEGFSRPRLIDIQKEINQSLIATFGANIDLSTGSVFSLFSGIFAEREDLLWQAAEDAYNSEYPDTAFGASLDNVGAISGIPRLGAMPSVIKNVKLFGLTGTNIPSGTQFAVLNSPTSIFQINSDVVLAAGQNCIQHVAFTGVPTVGTWELAIGELETTVLAYNANADAIQTALRALGTQYSGITVTGNYTAGFDINFLGDGIGGKQAQPIVGIPLNELSAGMTAVTVTPTITQAGVDQANVIVKAVANGPTVGNAWTLSVIVTPVSGMTAVLNIIDAELGRNVETDNEYRLRRQLELQVAGAGTLEAIRSKLLALAGVTAVIVFENVDEIPDLAGRPPKSFEAVVEGGLDDEIANEIWLVKPAGIKTDGSTLVPITDSQGQSHDIRFSRPTPVLIYVRLELTVNSNYPTNGDAAAKQAIVTSGNALGIGKEVVVIPYLISSISGIVGIEDAVLKIGTAPSPTLSNNIAIAANEIALFDTSRIDVIHV